MNDFIEKVGAYVKKYAPAYGIKVYSPIIAQFVLESAMGTSNKVVKKDSKGNTIEWRHNYAGLKYNPKQPRRCPSAIGFFQEGGSEQNADGSYTSSAMLWQKFDSLESCVKGYFEFLQNGYGRYDNLKGVTNEREYLEKIKADGYATSIQYVENLMNVIKKYDLVKFDTKEDDKMKKILLISGHGAGDSGASARLNGKTYREASETIKMVELICERLITYADVDVYPIDRNAYKDIKNNELKCDFSEYDYVLEIHFNACVNDTTGDGHTTGTEIYIVNSDNDQKTESAIVGNIAKTGIKNRGVKHSNFLVIKTASNAGAKAALLETCFIDDADDMNIYLSDREKVAEAVTDALISTLCNKVSNSTSTQNKTENSANSKPQEAYVVGRQCECPFKVKLLTDLNVRKSPNGFVAIPNGAHKGIIYTIVEVNGTWGRLKSGAGWISISSKYVTRA